MCAGVCLCLSVCVCLYICGCHCYFSGLRLGRRSCQSFMPEKHLTRAKLVYFCCYCSSCCCCSSTCCCYMRAEIGCEKHFAAEGKCERGERRERAGKKCELEKTRAKVTFTVIRALHFVLPFLASLLMASNEQPFLLSGKKQSLRLV